MTAEWLETDGLGGFASGCSDGLRRRRYHGLLSAALAPPGERHALVKDCVMWVDGPAGSISLSPQRYRDVTAPAGCSTQFAREPWPSFAHALTELTLHQELCMVRGLPLLLMRIRARGDARGRTLRARPLLSGRDFHTLEHQDAQASMLPIVEGGFLSIALRGTRVLLASNGTYRHAPDWYRDFWYEEERARGLDCEEDLATPGELTFTLERDAVLAFALDTPEVRAVLDPAQLERSVDALFAREHRRRAGFPSALHRAADEYVVARADGATIIAGYPWFGDWGRDTFIALRGIGIASERFGLTRDVLMAWAGLVSEGMLPNRFVEGGSSPEYNAVDASLWYVVVAGELLERAPERLSELERTRLERAIHAILCGYQRGTRHGIRLDLDGLLAAGEPGVQLTWMDAKLGDWVVTPRIGKPVEVQALWIRALDVGASLDERWRAPLAVAVHSFADKFWCEDRGHLYDVIDVDHQPGKVDASLRPNQLLALGGLGRALVSRERVARALDVVEDSLWTPLGLRSLAPGEASYCSRYAGSPRERDAAYHQGTVWPWLIGPFVDAWLALHGQARSAEAFERFVQPLLAHRELAGLGHVSEVADAAAPHTPGGCPFQAWSVAELLRLVIRLRV